MGMSLEEIVFLFTVSGLPWPPSRSVSASLHLYGGGGGAPHSAAGCFSKCLKGAVRASWCISWICMSAGFHTWARTICIPCLHLHSGVDPSSVGVHNHVCTAARKHVCKSVGLACVWASKRAFMRAPAFYYGYVQCWNVTCTLEYKFRVLLYYCISIFMLLRFFNLLHFIFFNSTACLWEEQLLLPCRETGKCM